MNRELIHTNAFIRALRRFLKRRPQFRAAVETALQLLAEDAFDARLKTHKLKGDLDGTWACSVGFDVRILFDFVQHEGAEAILLISIGTHDEVY